MARAGRGAGGGDAGVLDPAAVAARAHGGARHRGLRRRPRRRARDPGGEGAGRPAAAARAVAGARGRARPRAASSSSGSSASVRSRPLAIEPEQLASAVLGADRDADDVHDARARARGRRLAAGTARPVERGARGGRGAVALPGRRAGRAGRRAGPAGAVHDPRAARRSSARRSSSRSPAATSARRPRTARLLARDAARVGRRALGRAARCSSTRPRHEPDRVVCVVGAAGAGKTTALRAARRRPSRERRPGARCGAERPRRRRAPRRRRHPQPHPPPAPARRPDRGRPPARLRARRRRGRHGRDARARAAARPRRAGRGEGGPGRRPAPAPAGRRGRALPRPLRPTRRDRAQREPPPARPVRTRALAQLRDGDPEPYLAHAARRGRLHVDDDAGSRQAAAARRLVADRRARPRRHRDARLPPRRRPRAQRRRPHAAQPGRPARARGARGRRSRVPRRRPRPLPPQRRAARRPQRHPRNHRRRSTPRRSTLQTDGGALRSLDERYVAEHLEHGYALTGHAAQGATVERAFVLAPRPGRTRRSGATSPAPAPAPRPASTSPTETLEREAHGREPDRPDPPARIARALARSAAEPLALDQTRAPPRGSATRDASSSNRTAPTPQNDSRRPRRSSTSSAGAAAANTAPQLQAEIDRRRHALRLADKKLAQLPTLEPKPLRRRCRRSSASGRGSSASNARRSAMPAGSNASADSRLEL